MNPFLDKKKWRRENRFAFSLRDGFPVSKGHTLICPKREVSNLFDLSQEEIIACWDLLQEEQKELQQTYQPEGFNVGVNVGEVAGQTVFHVHLHLIPRYKGDHPNPRGGVRAVIPNKASY